jgi:3-methylcrotonyl-CoA carboxylase alpha subunit
MFRKLLIANRGEIACRIAQTARRLGIATVAVYSEADARAAHVMACDEAVLIGGAAPRDSYLRMDRILEAAAKTGAQAIHPGYGFLSENEAFAEACAKTGLVFVGPPAESIRAMGSKSAAKALMEQAAVPLVPGYHGDRQEPEFLLEQARRIGFPVLIKASAGGGGKGMRIVQKAEDFVAALASCQREAASSFGDDRVLVERYLVKPRHIEIQVFADDHGQAVYLFERDCSVQRRHQKVIEEAPAPGMTPERRAQMGAAAVAAARAVNYRGAGTVEFIAEPDGRFYFMEMNTRLQVEHPVTEMITGFDLVEWQLRVAAGEPLPVRQEQLQIKGHAIEARLYAETPEKGFLPSIGRIRHFSLPAHVAFETGADAEGRPASVRVDGGVREGDEISPNYDPMIAKLIVWGDTRELAIRRMAEALAQTRVVGVGTNVAFLARLMEDAAFVGADLDTGLIERQRQSLLPADAPAPEAVCLAAALVALEDSEDRDPWAASDGWRLGAPAPRRITLLDNGQSREIELHAGREGQSLSGEFSAGGHRLRFVAQLQPTGTNASRVLLELEDRLQVLTVVAIDDALDVFQGARRHTLQRQDVLRHAADGEQGSGGQLTAPMPGKVIEVLVKGGQAVKAGEALMVMEAMKMEHTLTAPRDGVVGEIFYGKGDQVADGAQLIELVDTA